jgi:hypothetical protein
LWHCFAHGLPAISRKHLVGVGLSAALQALRDYRLSAPMAARTLAIVDSCMYDAWAAYDKGVMPLSGRGLDAKLLTLDGRQKRNDVAFHFDFARFLGFDQEVVLELTAVEGSVA